MGTRHTIRRATPDDASGIVAVYNPYVTGCTCVWQTEPDTESSRRAWLSGRRERHPVYVATDDTGRILGFAALSEYSPRGGFAELAEISIYLAAETHGHGLGSRLIGLLLDSAKTSGLHGLVARISGDQPASLALHRKAGFAEVGRVPEAGYKFGKRLDLVYMHRFAR